MRVRWFVLELDAIELGANRVSLLLNNIACLKDHLKSWCKKNGKPFTGDQLMDSNRDAAIIHDLWNLDKHGGPSHDSKSGLSPRLLQDPDIALVLRGGGRPSNAGDPNRN